MESRALSKNLKAKDQSLSETILTRSPIYGQNILQAGSNDGETNSPPPPSVPTCYRLLLGPWVRLIQPLGSASDLCTAFILPGLPRCPALCTLSADPHWILSLRRPPEAETARVILFHRIGFLNPRHQLGRLLLPVCPSARRPADPFGHGELI